MSSLRLVARVPPDKRLAVATAVLKAADREPFALRLDWWARWIFPTVFAALHLVLCTT